MEGYCESWLRRLRSDRSAVCTHRGTQTSWDRWGTGAQPAARREPSAAQTGASFAVGDDVEHATMGDGVVIGLEPGGLVVVRFASDGSERKLMMDYAPIKKKAS